MDMILGESPMVTGTWYNPKTGHSFTARDTIFEDDKMYVITTDGQRISYDMLQQYVQSNDPDKDHRDFSKPNQAKDVLPPEVASEILKPGEKDLTNGLISQEDLDMINGKNPMYSSAVQRPELKLDINTNQPKEDEDDMLVRRMLKRAEHPLINCSIIWKGFPTKQIDMLDTMGVDYEKIADFYMKDLDIKDIQAVIKCAIVCEIEKHLHDDSEPKDFCVGITEEKKVVEEVKEVTTEEPKKEIEVVIEQKPAVVVKEVKTPSRRVQKRAAAKKAETKKTTKK